MLKIGNKTPHHRHTHTAPNPALCNGLGLILAWSETVSDSATPVRTDRWRQERGRIRMWAARSCNTRTGRYMGGGVSV